MDFKQFTETEQGKATQVVIAAALNIHGVQILNSDIEYLNIWLQEANDLDPDPLDTAGAGIIIAKDLVNLTPAKWDNVVVSKVEQVFNILVDATKNGIGRLLDLIGVVFQSKRKSLKKS